MFKEVNDLYQSRSIHIDHLPYRPVEGFAEPKQDRYGRIVFSMPEVRSLSALEIPMRENMAKGLKGHPVRHLLEPVKVTY